MKNRPPGQSSPPRSAWRRSAKSVRILMLGSGNLNNLDKRLLMERPYVVSRTNPDRRNPPRDRRLCPRYPTKQAAMLPALHLVNERLGYVPPQAVVEMAELLGLAPAQVQDTLSFYGFFKQDKPQGQYRVWVCRSISCAACGGEEMLGVPVREAGHPARRDHARRPGDAGVRRMPRGLRRGPGDSGQ